LIVIVILTEIIVRIVKLANTGITIAHGGGVIIVQEAHGTVTNIIVKAVGNTIVQAALEENIRNIMIICVQDQVVACIIRGGGPMILMLKPVLEDAVMEHVLVSQMGLHALIQGVLQLSAVLGHAGIVENVFLV